MSTAEAGHPAWCDPQHCSVTDEKVRVHEQAPVRWEDDTAGLRVQFESRLLDPGDDETTYLELRIHDLALLNQFFGILPLGTVRRLRDQLTEHLDVAENIGGVVSGDQSPLLLPEGCHPKGVLQARCGHLLPMMAMRFAEYSGTKCTQCHLTSVADTILSLRVDDAGTAVSDLVTREAS